MPLSFIDVVEGQYPSQTANSSPRTSLSEASNEAAGERLARRTALGISTTFEWPVRQHPPDSLDWVKSPE